MMNCSIPTSSLKTSMTREFEKALENYESPQMTCGAGFEPDFSNLTHQKAAELQIDIVSHALACNYADVGTFKMFDLQEQAFAHIVHPDKTQTFAGEGYHGAPSIGSESGLCKTCVYGN